MKSIIDDATIKTEKIEDRLEEFGSPKIMVVGTGGAGCNAVNRLANMGVSGAQLVAVNTDKQHLDITSADHKLLIGRELTRGLGAGGFPEKGMQAAKENLHDLKSLLKDSDMVFVCAGM